VAGTAVAPPKGEAAFEVAPAAAATAALACGAAEDDVAGGFPRRKGIPSLPKVCSKRSLLLSRRPCNTLALPSSVSASCATRSSSNEVSLETTFGWPSAPTLVNSQDDFTKVSAIFARNSPNFPAALALVVAPPKGVGTAVAAVAFAVEATGAGAAAAGAEPPNGDAVPPGAAPPKGEVVAALVPKGDGAVLDTAVPNGDGAAPAVEPGTLCAGSP